MLSIVRTLLSFTASCLIAVAIGLPDLNLTKILTLSLGTLFLFVQAGLEHIDRRLIQKELTHTKNQLALLQQTHTPPSLLPQQPHLQFREGTVPATRQPTHTSIKPPESYSAPSYD